MVAVAISAGMMVSVFAGFSLGWGLIHTTRDDLRATQILTQKIESIRLLTWSQLTNGCPSSFTGTIYHDYNVQFPDAALPIPAASFLSAPVTNGVHDFKLSGNYWVSDALNIKVEPGVSVTLHVVGSNFNFNPDKVDILGGMTNAGTLIVYQDSGSMSLGGNSFGGADNSRPINFQYYGLPGVTSISLSGTSTFVGVIYAPGASLTLNGGGNANNLIGAAIVNQVKLNGHYDFHYDESLTTNGPTKGYVPTSWQEL